MISNQLFIDKDSDPRTQSVWSITQLLRFSDYIELRTCLDEGVIRTKLIDSNEYDEAVYELLHIYCKKNDLIKQNQIFDFLNLHFDKNLEGNRVISIACFAQFINFASFHHSKDEKFDINKWRNQIIEVLSKNIDNSNLMIRKMSILGISNLCKLYMESCIYIENYIKTKENFKLGIKFLNNLR